MRKRGRYLLYLLPTPLVISAIVLSALFGTRVLHPTQKVSAAPANTGNIQSISELTAIVPLRPMWDEAVTMATTPALPACLKSTALQRCYTPQQIRQAYGVQSLLDTGITGKGRTITLIEAFQYPTLQTDLQLFDKTFGLPDTQVNVIAPFGSTPFNANDPVQGVFAGETALDIQWAHVMAPDATITVIQANVKQETYAGEVAALFEAAQYAVQQNIGDIISMSFGAGEQCVGAQSIQQMHATFQQARAQKQTLLASTGDSGSAVTQCDANGNAQTLKKGAQYPASDPLITGVGGTTLQAGPTGTYQSETTWNETDRGAGATGGGFSSVFTKPAFQRNIPGTTRGISDLSFDADPLSAVPVVITLSQPSTTQIVPFGGTSLGAPAVAGMIALCDQAKGTRLGFLNEALYRISQDAGTYAQAFHDIQSGNNPIVFREENGNITFVDGFKAAAGWDAPTGLGTPNATNLAKVLSQFIKPNDGSTL